MKVPSPSSVLLASLVGIGACGGRIDPSTNGSSSSGPQNGASTAVPSGSGAVTTTPTTGSCRPTPTIRTGFETGLDPSWPVLGPDYIEADTNSPITGARSLLVTLSSAFEHPYFTIPLPSVCRIKLTFTIRADRKLVETSSTTVARITAAPTAWFHVQVNPGGMMMLASEVHVGGGAGIGYPGSFGTLKPDTPTVVTVTVDYSAKSASAALAPVGSPMPKPTPGIFRVDERNPNIPGPITAVDIGAAPGFAGSSSGVYWLDDFVLE
jgi:hypothetical protein